MIAWIITSSVLIAVVIALRFLIQGRLNMIIANPKTVVPAMAAVLLIAAVCTGCIFTGPGKVSQKMQGQDFPAVEMVRITAGVNRTDLKSCIANAILTANTGKYHNGDYAAEAHTVLKTVENGSTTTVYAMALCMEFGYAGSGFFETGGSHMPAAITFEKNSAEEYILKEYWMPQDGSDYAPSIKEKFPSDISKDALDTQKYVVSHIQACYDQAIQFGKVNTDVEIAKLIETITSSPALMSNPHAYIQAHQAEYRKLSYYGNHTLRYCFTRFEQGGQTGLDGHIMASACRDILGQAENINLQADTGQEWYDAFKQSSIKLQLPYIDNI